MAGQNVDLAIVGKKKSENATRRRDINGELRIVWGKENSGHQERS